MTTRGMRNSARRGTVPPSINGTRTRSNGLQDALGSLRKPLHRLAVIPLDLKRHQTADAGRQHHDASLDRLQPARRHARQIRDRGQFCADLRKSPGSPLEAAVRLQEVHGRPVAVGFQDYHRFDHANRRRIQRTLGPPELTHDPRHLRNRRDHPVLNLHDALRLLEPGRVAAERKGEDQEQECRPVVLYALKQPLEAPAPCGP